MISKYVNVCKICILKICTSLLGNNIQKCVYKGSRSKNRIYKINTNPQYLIRINLTFYVNCCNIKICVYQENLNILHSTPSVSFYVSWFDFHGD